MGQACQCEGSKPEDAVKFTPRPNAADVVSGGVEEKAMQAPIAVGASMKKDANLPPEIQKLQGEWRTEADKQRMGKIEGNIINWDPIFNHNQSLLRVAASSNIEMELMGTVHRATYEEPGRLKWSDGECWVRVSA
eukprot:TRINITY_DN57642_c0_g1_i1.p1 TRINITY_DN57642_c0_g1~~TRINITY_DN57642_c0_g1_i1.p1  ORF type:complete len:135 (+),score=34.95 TRINITY_DN57642_c0_g1_i1:102-506(+)